MFNYFKFHYIKTTLLCKFKILEIRIFLINDLMTYSRFDLVLLVFHNSLWLVGSGTLLCIFDVVVEVDGNATQVIVCPSFSHLVRNNIFHQLLNGIGQMLLFCQAILLESHLIAQVFDTIFVGFDIPNTIACNDNEFVFLCPLSRDNLRNGYYCLFFIRTFALLEFVITN